MEFRICAISLSDLYAISVIKGDLCYLKRRLLQIEDRAIIGSPADASEEETISGTLKKKG